MATRPKIWCFHDRCCNFDPGSHNARYCREHKCKRKAENAVKRLTTPINTDEEKWGLQERKKEHRQIEAQLKNEWLLENKKIVMFDLETTNLEASIGFILCGCTKERNEEVKTFTARAADGFLDDREICLAMRDELEQADYVCTYYGSRFDLPFINTRLIVHGERPVAKIRHIDLYYTARFKLKLHSNKLAVVAETLFGESDKTRVLGPIWTRAMMGDSEAIKYIEEHCQIDVIVLQNVFERLRGFVNLSATRWRTYGGSY